MRAEPPDQATDVSIMISARGREPTDLTSDESDADFGTITPYLHADDNNLEVATSDVFCTTYLQSTRPSRGHVTTQVLRMGFCRLRHANLTEAGLTPAAGPGRPLPPGLENAMSGRRLAIEALQ